MQYVGFVQSNGGRKALNVIWHVSGDLIRLEIDNEQSSLEVENQLLPMLDYLNN